MKGTVQIVNGKYAVTYLKSKGFYGLLKYIKIYEIIPEQQEIAISFENKKVKFTIQNNLAVLNI